MSHAPRIDRRGWLATWLQDRRRSRRLSSVPSIVPTDVAGLKLWVRVESLAGLTNNATVASWPDESGNNQSLVQATAANRPLYKTNVNGAPAVYFDGVNDVLASVGTVLNSNQHTIFLVAQPSATESNDVVGSGNVTNGDILLMLAYAGHLRGTNWRGVANANLIDGATFVLVGVTGLFEQEVTASNIILRVNGVEDANRAMTGAVANVSKPIYLGSRNNAWFFSGYVRALLVYEGNPSPAEKTAIRNYLISTYGITVPYPLPPAPGAPTSLAGTDNGDSSVYLSWTTVDLSLVEQIRLERKVTIEADSTYSEIAALSATESEFWDYSVAPGTFANGYTYRVRSQGPGGFSPYSNNVQVII